MDRRHLLRAGAASALPLALAPLPLIGGCQQTSTHTSTQQTSNPGAGNDELNSKGMHLHYLEIVTKEVDAVCEQYSGIYGIAFGEPDPVLGGARTAGLGNIGILGVRAPMRDTEAPVVRPYFRVENIANAVEQAVRAGAKLALPPMNLPGHGTCAIVIHGGIDCGFWQV